MSMVHRGSSLGIAAGFLGMAAAGATLHADYMMSALGDMPAITIDNSLGWLEALLSVFVIGFARSSRTQPGHAAPLLLAVALIGMLVGNGYAVLCMLLATIGGILCVTADDDTRTPPPAGHHAPERDPTRPEPATGIAPHLTLLAAIAALFVMPFGEDDGDTERPSTDPTGH